MNAYRGAQANLALYWDCGNGLEYLEKLHYVVNRNKAYFNQFRSLRDLEKAVYHYIIRHQVFDFETGKYREI